LIIVLLSPEVLDKKKTLKLSWNFKKCHRKRTSI
jgi:hypothetical protein